MVITAKQLVETVDREEYELFTEADAIDLTDNPVKIKRSMGRYTLANLANRKKQLQAETDDINDKIAAIENLKTK